MKGIFAEARSGFREWANFYPFADRKSIVHTLSLKEGFFWGIYKKKVFWGHNRKKETIE